MSRDNALRAFAIAVFIGGFLGCFFPNSFHFFFGWSGSLGQMSLIGLGVMSAGFLFFELLRLHDSKRTDLAVAETLVLAGLAAEAIFILNFDMGYPLAMCLLVFFAGSVTFVGLYLRQAWS